MNTAVLILFFSAMGSTDLDTVKRIPKQNSVCVCVGGKKETASKVFIIQFHFFSLPRSTNQNMYDTPCPCCILYRQLLVQTTVHLLLFSIFVLQADSRESTEEQSSEPNNPNTQKCVWLCAWVLALTWLRAIYAPVLSDRCHATWLLFISSVPVLPSLRASLVLLLKKKKEQKRFCKTAQCGIKIGDVWV